MIGLGPVLPKLPPMPLKKQLPSVNLPKSSELLCSGAALGLICFLAAAAAAPWGFRDWIAPAAPWAFRDCAAATSRTRAASALSKSRAAAADAFSVCHDMVAVS